MKIRAHAFSVMLIALTLTSPPTANRDCRAASERYEAAISEVIDALRFYEKCILSNQKRDDCAGQLDELDSAHDEFADSVAEYPNGCLDERSRPWWTVSCQIAFAGLWMAIDWVAKNGTSVMSNCIRQAALTLVPVACSVALTPRSASAWDDEGHEIIARSQIGFSIIQ
jgi:hypothetical protein